jgi:hypothetical protein
VRTDQNRSLAIALCIVMSVTCNWLRNNWSNREIIAYRFNRGIV